MRAQGRKAMALFDRTARRLAGRPILLLAADPGPALLKTARLYDPGVRQWGNRLLSRRLIFSNGVLLIGPVTVTPKLAEQAGLSAGVSLAWYAGVGASRAPGSETEKRADGERLIRALAARLGGTTRPAELQPELALLASVYSEQPLASEQVIDVLRPYAGDLQVEEGKNGSCAFTGPDTPFYTAYWPPAMSADLDPPPALGPQRKQPLHHWDLHSGTRAHVAPRTLCLKIGEAALALAASANGMAIDMFGFPLSKPEDLLPR
jgi:hypothetical protein